MRVERMVACAVLLVAFLADRCLGPRSLCLCRPFVDLPLPFLLCLHVGACLALTHDCGRGLSGGAKKGKRRMQKKQVNPL